MKIVKFVPRATKAHIGLLLSISVAFGQLPATTITSDAAMHDRQLHEHQGHLSDCNFITRLLYKNSY